MRAPQQKPGFRTLLAFAVILAALVIVPAAQASLNIVGFFGNKGSAAGPANGFNAIGGVDTVAINDTGSGSGANAGDFYVGDSPVCSFSGGGACSRIQQYDSTGKFIRLFGPDVVLSGADDTGQNEQQTIDVPASVTGGTFRVEVVTAVGFGQTFESIVLHGVAAETGAFQAGDEIHGSGISPGTKITEVKENGGTLVLSGPHGGSGGLGLTAGETTEPIEFDAEANAGSGSANLQASLEALPAIGPGNVSVTGGPGASGTPFTVTFTGGVLAHDDVAQMKIVSSTLTGGSASVATVSQGGSPEVCNASSTPPDICKNASKVPAAGPAGMDGVNSMAVDPATGNLFVNGGFSLGRTLVFGSDGHFQGAFGWGVATGAPQLEFCTTVCQKGSFGDGAGQGPGNLTIDPTTGHLLMTGTNRVQEFSLSLNGSDEVVGVSVVRTFGWDVVESGPDNVAAPDEEQNIFVKAESGTFRLSFEGSQTGPIFSNAGPGVVQAELEALPTIGAGNVSVTGGVGSVSGLNPYKVTFGGSLGDKDLRRITGDESGLVLGTGPPSVTVTTVADGGAFEVCNLALNPTDVCTFGTPGTHLGQFGFAEAPNFSGEIPGPSSMAVNSAGVIYIVDTLTEGNGRVQTFTPVGNSYTPALFDPLDLSTSAPLGSIAIGPSDNIFVNKRFAAGLDVCPDGSSSAQEFRFLEVSPAEALLDTHLTCAKKFMRGFAVSKETGAIIFASFRYLDCCSQHSTIYFAGQTGPPTATMDTVVPTDSGATVTATINPGGPVGTYPNPPTTTYQLEYKKSADSTWLKWGKPIDVGFGFANVPVTIHLGKQDGNTSYDVRVVANKAYGDFEKVSEGSDVTAPQSFQTLPVRPTIQGFSTSALTGSSVDLNAQIHPHGADTTYRFEYGSTISYGSSAPVPDGEIPAASTVQSVSAHIEGLERGVVYHFRVVATNATGTTTSGDQTFNYFPPSCPNETLRQQTGSGYLPDCRAYELVSPGDAGNIILLSGGIPAPYASSPPRLSYRGVLGDVAGTEPTDSTEFNTYIATRTGTGWVSTYVGVKSYENLSETPLVGDLGLNTFLNRRDQGFPGYSSKIPYIWDSQGNSLGRWPADYESAPNSDEFVGMVQPSPDFTHMAFSSNNVDFDPGHQGLTTAPGSAYDYDVETETTSLISRTGGGAPIPQEPGNVVSPTEYILFPGGAEDDSVFKRTARINPGVSTDGSHILMSTASGPNFIGGSRERIALTRLYMRVNDIVTYEVSRGTDVKYLGMTADGSQVFFTSPNKLTPDDHDSSVDLFRWNETGDTLTRLSTGGGLGDSDNCHTDWISGCGVEGVLLYSHSGSGPDVTGNSIASKSGDIYFYSPELLAGPAHGLDDVRNLFVYRNGHVQFVAALEQNEAPIIGNQTPVIAMQVSPEGDHMSFITKSRLTGYDNKDFRTMYSYDPASEEVTCLSCLRSGAPPTADVKGSFSGRFMSDDGRTFFTTKDPVVVQDTNGLNDVYEYVDGRPQLITSGLGGIDDRIGSEGSFAGLQGVSADGVDVYFSTYETLVSQDHNGQYLKFYDARTGGGFPTPFRQAPCEAADECHGASSEAPPSPLIVSTRNLGPGGNASPRKKRKKHRARGNKHRHGRSHGRHDHRGQGAR